jgi:hypothetical protein
MDPDGVADTPEPVLVRPGIGVGIAAEDDEPSTISGAGGADAVREGGVDVYK